MKIEKPDRGKESVNKKLDKWWIVLAVALVLLMFALLNT